LPELASGVTGKRHPSTLRRPAREKVAKRIDETAVLVSSYDLTPPTLALTA
jgi:hypothetical protein